ncbi:MAG: cob(I)yrinic acid a,c-diamide adenosyltransferase [Candidatus Omnitrophica bacterium]|nr:cob(I)yrinic acid a,c-diamide adenosyltransferase [Candidatus Omnitrophota bacterium]
MQGLVHIYTGNGKGKTTAAFGLGMRAAGAGLKVCIFQFLKSKRLTSGEVESAKRLSPKLKVVRFNQTHPIFLSPKDRQDSIQSLKSSISSALKEVGKVLSSGRYDLVILDEVVNAVSEKYLDVQALVGLIDSRPEEVEMVLTGRNAPEEIIRMADYVTEMRDVKHPYKRGIKARKGIEW